MEFLYTQTHLSELQLKNWDPLILSLTLFVPPQTPPKPQAAMKMLLRENSVFRGGIFITSSLRWGLDCRGHSLQEEAQPEFHRRQLRFSLSSCCVTFGLGIMVLRKRRPTRNGRKQTHFFQHVSKIVHFSRVYNEKVPLLGSSEDWHALSSIVLPTPKISQQNCFSLKRLSPPKWLLCREFFQKGPFSICCWDFFSSAVSAGTWLKKVNKSSHNVFCDSSTPPRKWTLAPPRMLVNEQGKS